LPDDKSGCTCAQNSDHPFRDLPMIRRMILSVTWRTRWIGIIFSAKSVFRPI
jgi:hypothetical protein